MLFRNILQQEVVAFRKTPALFVVLLPESCPTVACNGFHGQAICLDGHLLVVGRQSIAADSHLLHFPLDGSPPGAILGTKNFGIGESADVLAPCNISIIFMA